VSPGRPPSAICLERCFAVCLPSVKPTRSRSFLRSSNPQLDHRNSLYPDITTVSKICIYLNTANRVLLKSCLPPVIILEVVALDVMKYKDIRYSTYTLKIRGKSTSSLHNSSVSYVCFSRFNIQHIGSHIRICRNSYSAVIP
jgi:hypothetical protein